MKEKTQTISWTLSDQTLEKVKQIAESLPGIITATDVRNELLKAEGESHSLQTISKKLRLLGYRYKKLRPLQAYVNTWESKVFRSWFGEVYLQTLNSEKAILDLDESNLGSSNNRTKGYVLKG